MDVKTRDMLINSALRIAVDATGLFPISGQIKAGLEIARDAAPVVEAAVEYFQTAEGQRAISHVKAVFGAIQTTSGDPVGWSVAKAIDALERGDA